MRRSPAIHVVILAAFACLSIILTVTAQEAQEARPLEPGKPVERELAGGQTHVYQLTLAADQYLHLVVEQRGVDVVVAVSGPDGKSLAEVDSPNGTQGPEPVSLVTEMSGSYRLEVRSLEKGAAAGRYEVRIRELRAATQQDRDRIAAEKAYAEGQQLREQGTAASLRKAIEKYQEALLLWRALGDSSREADTLYPLGLVHYSLGEKQKALDYFQPALTLWRAAGNRLAEAIMLNDIGATYRDLGEKQKALDYFQQTLLLRRALGDRVGEATAFNNLGSVCGDLGEQQQALGYYQQALPLYRAAGDRGGEANTLSNIGATYGGLGEYQKALDYHHQALPVRRALKDSRGEAHTLINIGLVHSYLGEQQRALDYYLQALPLLKAVGDRQWEAYTLNDIGAVYRNLGERQKALDCYQQALALLRAVGDRQWEANTLNNIGAVYGDLGQQQKALDYYFQALPIRRAVGHRQGEASTLSNIGAVYGNLGEHQKALDYFQQALPLRRAVGDRVGEATTHYGIARVERDRGNLDEARANIEASLNLTESLRTKVAGQQLRASYFASVQNYYEFSIDLLMRLHQRRPSQGLDSLALQASERARARSLLETLTEARADIRQGVDPALLERERSLQQQLNAREQARMQLLSRKHTPEQAAVAEKELRDLATQYQDLQTQIKTSNPRYAALTQPQPLTLAEIQQQVLDADTLLLEYALGEERSYLWVVSQDAVTSFELPKRAEVEAAARRFYDSLIAYNQSSRDAGASKSQTAAATSKTFEAGAALSRILLSPVAAQLGAKRLLIVADGALQYIPFAALPKPGAGGWGLGAGERNPQPPIPNPQPLIVDHEVVSLPSASSLAVLRKELAGRKAAAKALAVFADPVFSADDPRLQRAQSQATAQPAIVNETRGPEQPLMRSARESGVADAGLRISRLLATRDEAAAIVALVPEAERKLALNFDASRAAATSEELSQYRIIHFATHGLLNSQHPELSGIVLSLVDAQGKPQDGFLRLHEIYNLRLPAELVVLSACQTGLGKEIKGEGLVGLTRGFMYAGAPRVVASLWKVEDRATAELMKRLYQGMIKDGLRPAAALRAAQVAMWKQKRWQEPYYWAAFVLQGEWK